MRKNTKEEKVSLLYYDPVFFEVRTKTYLAVGSTKAPDESLKIKTKQQSQDHIRNCIWSFYFKGDHNPTNQKEKNYESN